MMLDVVGNLMGKTGGGRGKGHGVVEVMGPLGPWGRWSHGVIGVIGLLGP